MLALTKSSGVSSVIISATKLNSYRDKSANYVLYYMYKLEPYMNRRLKKILVIFPFEGAPHHISVFGGHS